MPVSLSRLCLGAFVPLVLAATLPSNVAQAAPAAQPASAGTLQAFTGERQLQAYIAKIRRAALRERRREEREAEQMAGEPMPVSAPPNPPAPPPAAPPAAEAASGVAAADSITNVQTAGVDEGGIVKKAGDYLVVLRRGRLFSISVTPEGMRSISAVDAFGPGINGRGAWYDELLISGDTLVVVGYSYERGGTEVGLFHLAKDGRISYRSTYHLTGNDYYSSRNYASRLIGNTLVFYTPIDLFTYDYETRFPSVRRWNGEPKGAFERIVPAESIYRSGLAEAEFRQTLHTVTRCELSAAAMDCRSSAVLGPPGGTFYVSRESVYVWVVDDWRHPVEAPRPPEASVLRLPLDGAAPSALRVYGSPIDQMSFLEADGRLNVLVGANARGARMWAPETQSGGLALLRVPLAAFGGSAARSLPHHYRALPSDPAGYWGLQNRYVGNWLLYGGARGARSAYALRIERNDEPVELGLAHTVERIEAMGADAMIAGGAGADLYLSSVALGEGARKAAEFVLPNMAQGESRTHGFFYRPTGAGQGVFGLPVLSSNGLGASVQFLRNEQLRLRGIGGLAATTRADRYGNDDGCVASCVDWYGNARPIFIGDRAYALLGYELVEGELLPASVRETRRLDFSPKPVGVN